MSSASAAETLLYQVGVAALVLLVYAGLTARTSVNLTLIAVLSLLFQCLLGSLFSYLAWFWLLRRYLASRLAIWSFLTPFFAVGFGATLLQEPVDLFFAIGALVMLTGIVLVSFRAPVRR